MLKNVYQRWQIIVPKMNLKQKTHNLQIAYIADSLRG